MEKVKVKLCGECGGKREVKVSVFLVSEELLEEIKGERDVEILFDKLRIIERGDLKN